jgi:hypothetical protein
MIIFCVLVAVADDYLAKTDQLFAGGARTVLLARDYGKYFLVASLFWENHPEHDIQKKGVFI